MNLRVSLIPGQPAPALDVPLAGGGTWSLAGERPEHFTMIVFYRGKHCHVCSQYLPELELKLDEFARRGVQAIAISSDREDRAVSAKRDWKLDRLRVGYALDLDRARDWGLYITEGKFITRNGLTEPDLFTEPAVYLVDAWGSLYYGSVQTMPFARPGFTDLLYAVDFAIAKNYPARGDVVDYAAVLKRLAVAPNVRIHLHQAATRSS